MTLRKISLILSKYIAIFLCVITLLLTTPWGSQLTLLLANNINGVAFDYHSGSLIRDVKLNSVHLEFDTQDITIKGLSTALDFSCVLKNTLCIKSATVDYLSLRYLGNNKNKDQVSKNKPRDQLFEMPFSIEANSIEIKESNLIINNSEITIDQLITQLSINKSEFKLFQPKVKQITLTLEQNKDKAKLANQQTTSPINRIVSQLPEINLPIALLIDQLHVDGIVVETNNHPFDSCKSDCTQWRSSKNQLSGTWKNTDVSIQKFQTTTPTFSILKLTANAKLTTPYQLSAHAVTQLNDIEWWPEVAHSTQQVSLQGSFEALTFDVISKGNLSLTSNGEMNLAHEDIPFKLTMDAQNIPTPFSLSHYGAYSALSLKLSGDIKQQAIELTSQVKGYGYNNAKVKIVATHQKSHLSINKFQFNDSESLSQLDLQGKLTILPTDIAWQVSASSTGLSLPTISLPNVTKLVKNKKTVDFLTNNLPDSITGRLQGNLDSTGTWSDNKWSVKLTDTHIVGKLNNIDLTIKANIDLNQSGHQGEGRLFVDFNNNKLTLQVANSDFWEINGQLIVDNINHWHHDVNGSLTSDFSITGEQNNPVIRLNSQFTELNWQNLYSTVLEVKARYQPMSNHEIQLTVNNDQLRWVKENKIFSVDDLLLTLNGNANQHQIQMNWLGNSTGQLSLAGHWNNDFTHWHSSIKQSKFTYLNATLQNDHVFDFNINLATNESLIESHCWRGEGLNICLPNQADIGNSGDIAVKLSIDLSVIDELFLPKNIELISKVDGDINVNWSTQQPIEAKANFSLSSGYLKVSDDFSEHQISQWSQGVFTFIFEKQLLTNKLLLKDVNNMALLNIMATVEFINDYPVNAKISLDQFNLQPFQAILTDVVNLQGMLTADISVDGTLIEPLFNGGITVDKGKLQLSQNANKFDNISTIITIEDNQAKLDGKFYLDDTKANLQGDIAWQHSLTMNLDLTAEELPLIFPPQLVMKVSPYLNFSLIDKSLTVSGNIDVLSGSYNIKKLPQSIVSLSDDVIIIDQHGKTLVKKSSGLDIKTNINVNINKAFKIEGQGLQSNLFGQLEISQKENQPFQLFGKIQSTDGTFQAYGQKLKIEKGELTFNGPIDNPYFNIRASRDIKAEDIDVGIQLTGLADALDMQLFSSPVMEMPDILSYLVRGRGLDTGTEKSTAAASLLVGFGVTNSFGLFDQLEKIPLLNNIAVDTEGEGDNTQATVSGYVGNRVYLKYGIGVYEPINELTVRMFIFNRFWLEIVSGIEQSSDFYYSFDID